MPGVETIVSQMVGAGSERPQRLGRGWSELIEFPISGDLNTETGASLGGRHLGGDRTVSAELAVGAGAYDITTKQQRKGQGRTPKMSTIGFDFGSFKYVYPSLAVQAFNISWAGKEKPKFTANMRNTGYWLYNATAEELEALGFDAAFAAAIAIEPVIVPPVAPVHHTMHPAAVRVTFADSTGTVDYAAEADLLGGQCGMTQEIDIEQGAGDVFFVPNNRKLGCYARVLHRGDREPSASLDVNWQSDLHAFSLGMNGKEITSLEYLFQSDDHIGNSNYWYEFSWKCAVSQIMSVKSNPKGKKAAATINFYPNPEAVTGAYWEQRIRTHDNTLQ
jgi:hypothetical protein